MSENRSHDEKPAFDMGTIEQRIQYGALVYEREKPCAKKHKSNDAQDATVYFFHNLHPICFINI